MPEPTDLSAPEQDLAIRPMRRTNLNALFLPSTGPVMFFDSGEHAVIPLSLPFPGGVKYDAATYQMTYNAPGLNGVAISYGQMMALAGDFYADPNNPISNQSSLAGQMQQVQNNVNSLLVTPASKGEAQSILAVIHKEIAAAVPMAWRGLPASNIYATQYFDYQYNGITGGSYTSFKSSPRGRYLLIAATNWDHFGQHAVTCYIAAHTLALSIANDGSTEMDLQQAYAINAFADHYLSDLFSAGHIRTPRRQMYQRQFPTGVQHPAQSDYDSPTSGMSGSIAKAMHDEDSVNGLWATNPAGDQWLCMGDGQYRNVANYANAALVQLAVNQSIQEVFAAFHGGPIPTSANYAALRLIPKLQTGSVNYSPMLVPTSNDVLIRTQLSNLNDQQHTTFNLVSTYGSLPSTPVKGPGLLGLQVTTLPSIPEGVVPAQLGSYGAAELAQPPFSFGVSSAGAVHLAYLKGLQIVYAIFSSGGSTWKWIDTISSGASAPGISPHPVNVEVFYISGNDLANSGTMIPGQLQHAYQAEGDGSSYLQTGSWGGSLGSAPVVAAPTNKELSVFNFKSDLRTLSIVTRDSSGSSNQKTPTSVNAPDGFYPAGQMTVVAMGAGDYRVFVPTPSGGVSYYTHQTGWQTLNRPEDLAVTSLIAAASWGSTRLDWFARNENGTLSHNWYNAPNWDNDGEVFPSISLIGSPCAASLGMNQVMAFYIAPDFTVRCHEYDGNQSTSWVEHNFAFKAISSPVAVATPSLTRVDLMVMGTDNSLYHTWRIGSQAWNALQKVSVNTTLA